MKNELCTPTRFGTRLSPIDLLFRNLAAPTWEEDIPIQVDIVEDAGGYRVRADLPGSTKEDISIDIEGNEVTISATRSDAKEVKEGERVVMSERKFGMNRRSFQFPVEIDRDNAKAEHKDGVLNVFLPKKATAMRSTVKIE